MISTGSALLCAIILFCLKILYNGAAFWTSSIATITLAAALYLLHQSFYGSGNASSKSVYNLNHGRLNLHLPPDSMWMNMGYWNGTEDFPTACSQLLELVLHVAGHDDGEPSWSIIDLGFGCGDQTLHLNEHSHRLGNYIGITIDATQFQYAEQRMNRSFDKYEHIKLFLADAASPNSWSPELKGAVERWKAVADGEKWILALDTMYHFSPSRWPVLGYACKELGASLMGFDLLLAPQVPLLQRLFLRVVTQLMGAHWTNFVTEAEYQSKLEACGYKDVEIRDVSEQVFGPLADFMHRQDAQLKAIGLGLGTFKAAAWLFRWWATSGIVRGCVVVAKVPASDNDKGQHPRPKAKKSND